MVNRMLRTCPRVGEVFSNVANMLMNPMCPHLVESTLSLEFACGCTLNVAVQHFPVGLAAVAQGRMGGSVTRSSDVESACR